MEALVWKASLQHPTFYGLLSLCLCLVGTGKKITFSKVPLTNEDVGDRPHPLLRHHDPDDDEVAARGDRRHRDEEHRPYELPPPRENVGVHIVCIVGTR